MKKSTNKKDKKDKKDKKQEELSPADKRRPATEEQEEQAFLEITDQVLRQRRAHSRVDHK